MPTFIMTGKYSAEAVKKITEERTLEADEIVRKCGGAIVTAYATLGESDILVIAEFSDVSGAMKASVGLTQALGISFATMPALPIEDFDKLVGSLS